MPSAINVGYTEAYVFIFQAGTRGPASRFLQAFRAQVRRIRMMFDVFGNRGQVDEYAQFKQLVDKHGNNESSYECRKYWRQVELVSYRAGMDPLTRTREFTQVGYGEYPVWPPTLIDHGSIRVRYHYWRMPSRALYADMSVTDEYWRMCHRAWSFCVQYLSLIHI